MNKTLPFLLILLILGSCEVAGVNEPTIASTDTLETLSSTDSAFVNLKKTVKPILADTVKDEKGMPMVWNGKDGLRIEWENRTNINPIEATDLVMANFEARAMGRIYDHNRDAEKPLPLKLGVGQLIKGWEQALLQMSVGDKGRIMIPSALGYGENGYLGKVPRNADIIIEIEIVGKVKPQVLAEGVRVFKYESGPDANKIPVKNQTITFEYFTYKMGKKAGLYDNSYAKGQPFAMKFENDNVVDGLHQGMAVLRSGDRAFIEIPTELAYGNKGLVDLVPPNTDIVFDVRIESIK